MLLREEGCALMEGECPPEANSKPTKFCPKTAIVSRLITMHGPFATINAQHAK